jgi:hypothetical protein
MKVFSIPIERNQAVETHVLPAERDIKEGDDFITPICPTGADAGHTWVPAPVIAVQKGTR